MRSVQFDIEPAQALKARRVRRLLWGRRDGLLRSVSEPTSRFRSLSPRGRRDAFDVPNREIVSDTFLRVFHSVMRASCANPCSLTLRVASRVRPTRRVRLRSVAGRARARNASGTTSRLSCEPGMRERQGASRRFLLRFTGGSRLATQVPAVPGQSPGRWLAAWTPAASALRLTNSGSCFGHVPYWRVCEGLVHTDPFARWR